MATNGVYEVGALGCGLIGTALVIDGTFDAGTKTGDGGNWVAGGITTELTTVTGTGAGDGGAGATGDGATTGAGDGATGAGVGGAATGVGAGAGATGAGDGATGAGVGAFAGTGDAGAGDGGGGLTTPAFDDAETVTPLVFVTTWFYPDVTTAVYVDEFV
jgi:hypothetical protein